MSYVLLLAPFSGWENSSLRKFNTYVTRKFVELNGIKVGFWDLWVHSLTNWVLQSQRMTDAVEMASPLASSAARRTGIRNAGTRACGISSFIFKEFLIDLKVG